MTKIAIIIPFFQRKNGILKKAIDSILTQNNAPEIEVIVVDDGSLVSAKLELELIRIPPKISIRIFEQNNKGPAAARNHGLNQVSPDCEFVAFLDSDDEWSEDHLENALLGLTSGYDFYFSDHMQLNAPVSAFVRAKRLIMENHHEISPASSLYSYQGDFFNQILTGNVVGTSTVVYRFKKFPKLRFRESFVYAGEDYLFWMELAKLTDKIVFSTRCECTYGSGVNIFSGSGWGTEKSLVRIHYEIKFNKAIAEIFSLTKQQNQICNQRLHDKRVSFVADILHRLRHHREIEMQVLKMQLRSDPQTFIFFIPLVISLVFSRRS